MAEEFSKLVEQTKLNNDKQDRVIDLLEQANKPEPKRELQRASKDEVDAEYDVLKKGNIFTVAYNRLSGIDRADDILSKELTPAQVKTNAMLDDLTNKNIQQNETLNKIGFSSIKMLKPTEKTNLFNLSFEATAGAPVPQIENGYIVKDDQDNGFYIEPHGYLDENLNKQSLDAVITPTKNLELPLVGSFVKGADVIPKLINKFNPKYILSSTIGGDAKYSGLLNNFISVQDYEEELNCNLVDLKSMQSIMI